MNIQEIKDSIGKTKEYKVWDIKLSKFINGYSVCQDGKLLSEGLDCLYRNGNPARDEEFIKVDYTGLKDRNGKKIFEGYILQTIEGGIGYVRYYSEWCRFNLVCDCKRFDIDIKDEIIGNIFNNPELLFKKT